jgi:hypothetical protein
MRCPQPRVGPARHAFRPIERQTARALQRRSKRLRFGQIDNGLRSAVRPQGNERPIAAIGILPLGRGRQQRDSEFRPEPARLARQQRS